MEKIDFSMPGWGNGGDVPAVAMTGCFQPAMAGNVCVCHNCGHIFIGENAPETCPVCKYSKAFFALYADPF